MSKTNKSIMAILIAFLFAMNTVLGQGHDLQALENEYPQLMKRYGCRLENRTAHYIFAIDISSSMLEYEDVVRQSLATFVNAVPDGDQITLIAMCDENNTNYINSIKCITINPTVKQSIIQTINSPQFRFLHSGNPNDGSDGYTMTRKVLEAMNVVNSSDLTFVYLLTDFEYWTHKYKYDKTKENWDELKSLLTEKHRGMMCKYGIELNYYKVSHPEAIFKSELDNIFGQLDYQQANSAVILAQWFGHIINDIRAHKINAMLNTDWKEYLDSFNIVLQRDGQRLNALIDAQKSDLVSGIKITLTEGGGERLTPYKNVNPSMNNDNLWMANIGHVKIDKTWYPSQLKEEPSTAHIKVLFESPYAEEIFKLQGLCQENKASSNVVNFDKEYVKTIPEIKLWNAFLPWWTYVLILLVLLGIIASIIYTSLIHPERRNTYVVVKRSEGGTPKQYYGDTAVLPMTIGAGCDVNVLGANWTLKIISKKYNPIITWCSLGKCKSGYYAILEDGDYAEVINDYTDEMITTISTNKAVYLFPYKKAPKSRIEITEGTTTNRIEIN